MPKRKIRTREHIIADISENHFESFALMKGFSTEITVHDYGYDIITSTYDVNGKIENGFDKGILTEGHFYELMTSKD